MNGEHLNCDLDPNDPNYVCIGHDGANGIYRLNLILAPTIVNNEPDGSTDRAVIMAHISRPSHNHRLLNSQVSLTEGKCKLPILIRKEAPCDILLFLELWMDSKDEPYSFEAYGSVGIKSLLETNTDTPMHIELKDVTGAEQGSLEIQLVKPMEALSLLKTCSHPQSLSNNRQLFKDWLEQQYHPKLIESYQKQRPGDEYHWYTSVQSPHERVALGTIVYMTRHVSFPKEEGSTDHIWDLLFDLGHMEVMSRPADLSYVATHYWNQSLTPLQRAKIINYMFTLPFTGHTYVVDRVRGSKGLKMDTDIWSFLRTRPLSTNGDNGASFDCEDAALYMLESIYVFKNATFKKGSLLEAVQQTLKEEYQEWFTLCMLQVQGSTYEAHATVCLEHLKGGIPILLEGTCLTAGAWKDSPSFIDKDEIDHYDDGYNLFFCELNKIDSTVAWTDMIQYSMPMSGVRHIELYKTPMTMVSCPEEGAVDQKVFTLDETMDDSMDCCAPDLQFGHHPLDPPEFQPISWFDCSTVSKEKIEELDPYHCACNGSHSDCWFYYTSIAFYTKHKSTIAKALKKEHYVHVITFNAGRELSIVRICVCRCQT